MKFQSIILFTIFIACLLSCSEQKIIELPLTQQAGYGYFNSSLGGVSRYSEDINSPWNKTYLKVSGAPENWTNIKFGDIETNIYQSVYQNYLLGKITKEWYEELQKTWDWKPDTLELSKEPLKCKIAFAYGKDSMGVVKMIVDANNNLDFSDDESFVPYNMFPNKSFNKDSVAQNNSINVSYERFIGNKKVLTNVPIFIAYMSEFDMFLCNFPQYSVANINGDKIAVCSNGFTNLLYKNPSIVLISDNLKEGDKISGDNLIAKNEYIEIKGNLYENMGVNQNRNTLVLEKMDLSKNELYSTQIGYKPYLFEGKNFENESQISLNEFKGKYVLLDFWAVWCVPCLKEIPNLKELYKKTDRRKFEIIGIVAESPSNILKEIIEKDSISWPQILSTDSNKIKEAYRINGYPTTYLINPEGIIIAKNLRGKELEEKVFDLINE